MKAARRTLGWGTLSLAMQLSLSQRIVKRMEAGEVPVKQDIAEWLRLRLEMHARFPPPVPPSPGRFGSV